MPHARTWQSLSYGQTSPHGGGLASKTLIRPMLAAVPHPRHDHVATIQNRIPQDIGTTAKRSEPLAELGPRNTDCRVFGNTVSRIKNHRRSMPGSSWTVWSKEVVKTRHIIQRVGMPGQRGHSVRFPSARSASHALARSCATPGVPDKNESSRERSISSDNASANTAATYSSTDCPDRCAAVTTAASSSSGNATVSITTPKYLTRLYCSRSPRTTRASQPHSRERLEIQPANRHGTNVRCRRRICPERPATGNRVASHR